MNKTTPEIDWLRLSNGFELEFGYSPTDRVVSPGRVNLIGDHIDYCGGQVLPMAINRSTQGVFAANNSSTVNVYSTRFAQRCSVVMTDLAAGASHDWVDYVRGVLRCSGQRRLGLGFDLYLDSNLSAGGLSSSASLTAALSVVLHQVASGEALAADDLGLRLEYARQCQKAENDFVGVSCGIMDQVSVLLGGLLQLDCGNLATRRFDVDPGEYSVVVMDSAVPRTLAASGYNQRVTETSAALALLREPFAIRHLAELEPSRLPEALALLETAEDGSRLARRVRHVVSEHQRVLVAGPALASGSYEQFGQLMNDSHASLRDDFEVSTPELDQLVDIAQVYPGVPGARLTGAGFGGCAIALVHNDSLAGFEAEVAARYLALTGLAVTFTATLPAPAAHTAPLSRLP